MTRLRALLPLAAVLAMPAEALAAAGGGSSGYSGGGGGGYSGGGSSGGSGDGDPIWFVIFAVGFALFFAYGEFVSWRLAKKRRARDARVRTASAAAAEDDHWFAAEAVERDAATLFRATQEAWNDRDRDRLARLVGDDLMVEWRRRLDDFDRKGWHNQVAVLSGPQVQYVGITNREDDTEDRVVVRVSAGMRDVVVTKDGTVRNKDGAKTPEVDSAEYWTLARRGDGWIVLSIEQDTEGVHHLDAPLVTTPWEDTQSLHDEAVVERAAADASLPAGTKAADLVDLDFADDARKAALDLALVDQRFGPEVLEVAARRAVSAWAEAVDGSDAVLEAIADAGAVRDLLYGGDGSERTRLVVRGPQLEALAIVALDGETDPPSFTVEARVRGRRYVENRDTLATLSGSKDRETTFTERWRLTLTGDADQPWRISSAAAPATT